TYAEDPAIAFVEINNENGIFHQYFDGAVDAWPEVFRDRLDLHWNTWLQSRYSSTEEAEAAWGAIDEPLGEEALTNPGFSGGTGALYLELHCVETAVFQSGAFVGRAGVALRVAREGSADWHVQLYQGRLSLAAGHIYTLGFWARSPE